ncbi:MAG: hypothetical protein HW413_1595, partial [Thermoleophilia bacterium]|nr:hypothetical protein [Thermoleophilia bacterium]
VVSVDRLVEELWPGTPPETASHAVQVYVSQLRKALGDAIARRGPGYVLYLEPGAVDIHRFARLVADGHEELRGGNAAAATGTLGDALALWRGPALADFAYEPFAQAEIAHLDDLRFAALEDRIDADLLLGRHVELIAEIEALVEAQPLRERPRALLMRALYLAGRQAEALAAYRAARETLIEDLGIEPGPELKELEAAILRQDEALLPAAPSPVMRTRRLAAVLSVGLEAVGAIDLEVEDRELDTTASAVIAAVTRHGGVAERLADGSVTAVFGVPVAHEDDPLRAARAALEARTALAPMDSITFSVGIEIGEVVAADRTASGPPVRAAALLRQAAADGEVLVSETAARRLTHAAQLEPKGDAWTLIELAEHAPAFERRLDAPLVGRKRELAALRKILKRAVDGSTVCVAVVVGPPGVGKSRLAAELTRRARGVTTLWGRCLSYGDGITYWPLRQALGQAPSGDERNAVLAALEAETSPPAPEIAWLFRRYCDALAREKPVVVVFDDIHWAEPTFLELVEQLADKGNAPILVLCIAREELLEDRPDFLEGRDNAVRVVLDALSAEETDALLDGLGGGVLDTDQRAHIITTAEGNPFFLEQLLALALEGGLLERALPETVQALLAARLDRLGPGERAVLERGSVVGREFSAEDVVALLDAAAVPTARTHLRTLSDRGFVRPRGNGAFGFRHVLVQEAVYRSAPKRVRAELHERFADRLDEAYAVLPELDEFVGYHLEQAHRLRTELGESDRRAERLAYDAGHRLGAAGNRAWRRNDEFATVNLLRRATSLLPPGDEMRRELLSELSIALLAIGEPEAAESIAAEAISTSEAAADHRRELRGHLELACLQLFRDPATGSDGLLDVAARAIPAFESAHDHRALGRAWLLVGYVHGVIRCRHQERQAAAERALIHYRAARLPTSSCLGEIAASLYHGPEAVPDALERCEELQDDSTAGLLGRANVLVYQGGLEAQRGEFGRARELIEAARLTFDELGQLGAVSARCRAVLGDVELMAGDPIEAEGVLRAACDSLERIGDWHSLSGRAADLAEALLMQGRLEEAERWSERSTSRGASVALPALVRSLGVRARLAANRNEEAHAVALAREAVSVANRTDALNLQGRAFMALSEVLRLSGSTRQASGAAENAARVFREKGNLVALAQVRALSPAPLRA